MPEAAGEAVTAPRRGFFQSSVRSLESVAETLLVPAVALAASLVLFGVFLALIGTDPFAVYVSIYQGAFGSWFSWQNTLARAGPLMLTALLSLIHI